MRKAEKYFMSTPDQFVIIGCGHSESFDNFNNNALVKSSQGNLLIDAGYTIKNALHAQGMTIKDINAVFITHVHGDHVFGLERLAYESKFRYQTRIALYYHESLYDELWHQTLKGSMGKHGDGEASLEDYFDLFPIASLECEIYSHQFQLFQNKHTPGKPSFGININEKLFFSGDTTAIPEIISDLTFDVGFHDVTLSPFNPVHASINSLIEKYPLDIRKKLYLMSYEDHWPEYATQVEENFLGFARQGMHIALT